MGRAETGDVTIVPHQWGGPPGLASWPPFFSSAALATIVFITAHHRILFRARASYLL